MNKRRSQSTIAAILMICIFIGFTPKAIAAENALPQAEYWTDVSGLNGYSMSSAGATIGKIKFGLDGANSRLWAIAGVDAGDANALALLATTPIDVYREGIDISRYSTSPFVTNMDSYLSASYFSAGEKSVMNPVTVKAWEYVSYDWPNRQGTYNEVSVPNKLLYEPNSFGPEVIKYNQTHGVWPTTIYVGVNDDIAIELTGNISVTNGFDLDTGLYINLWLFHLRNCDDYGDYHGTLAMKFPNWIVVGTWESEWLPAILPALNLNTSSVLFASAADAASSTYNGAKLNSSMEANTFTLRFPSTGSEAAYISQDGTSIEVKNATGKYLMVQNADGVYALAINSGSEIVNASDISITGTSLDNFNNCKVWLESTDADRITTAKFATASAPHTVVVNNGDGDGEYHAGATVTITAGTAPSGQEFDKWIIVSGGVTLTSSSSESTTFTMPNNNVEVTAVYRDIAVPSPSPPETPLPVPPQTGESDVIYFWFASLIFSAAVLCIIMILKGRKQGN